MPARRIQVGEVWKLEATGETYLVTKLYNEALATFAVLRKTGAEEEPVLRVRLGDSGGAQILPGFTPTQDFENL